MRFAREHGIPGQGRGSAADSIVAYLLGVTRVDPVAHDLLFERFLHEDHQGTPDIDIDFSTDHREQVLQYVYEKYGPDRTGMVANVVTFRPRMAIRQVGAAMGFPETVIDKLGTHTDGWYMADIETMLTSAVQAPQRRVTSMQAPRGRVAVAGAAPPGGSGSRGCVAVGGDDPSSETPTRSASRGPRADRTRPSMCQHRRHPVVVSVEPRMAAVRRHPAPHRGHSAASEHSCRRDARYR